MPIFIEKIMDSFPYLTITPIIGQPDYGSIIEIHLQLNTNTASVQSHLGNGALDLLFLTITPAVYNILSNVPFIAPNNPSIEIVIPVQHWYINNTSTTIITLQQ